MKVVVGKGPKRNQRLKLELNISRITRNKISWLI